MADEKKHKSEPLQSKAVPFPGHRTGSRRAKGLQQRKPREASEPQFARKAGTANSLAACGSFRIT
jgi:hypothetical protein